eukprot:921857-Pleurochrysis_carterae.AAC.1
MATQSALLRKGWVAVAIERVRQDAEGGQTVVTGVHAACEDAHGRRRLPNKSGGQHARARLVQRT